ncbi:hypothetical protein [Candidatus Macondimonas diazotrophica]|uniref:Uncharacterized protein n=1 Tax=Candidatus Macondimonas diazotrophica TaxID=2305248 RepID=A0A4Z0FDE7_9GAMM|nr:hypothetical protein [Candidatus Macondimonas diazotrophica]TFZ83797.1 hypothetical protein E4680_02105 [Candidatus Macondimonas diazotrophica]HBG31449.1 hypothetical protein [Gammaproteobacteria bacterium]HBG51872.1 hypothetical protein [Gammaproteobacteria bacterium]
MALESIHVQDSRVWWRIPLAEFAYTEAEACRFGLMRLVIGCATEASLKNQGGTGNDNRSQML